MVLQLTCTGLRGRLRAGLAAFTLVELLVTVSVLLVLGSLTFVSFRPFLQERRLRQAAVELQAQLLRARTVAQKLQSSCQVTQTNSTTRSFGANASFTGNACTASSLPAVSLSGTSNADGLGVVAGTATTFTFNGNGSLAGTSDATTILSADSTATQWCVKATAPAGLIVVGSRLSANDTCNYVRD